MDERKRLERAEVTLRAACDAAVSANMRLVTGFMMVGSDAGPLACNVRGAYAAFAERKRHEDWFSERELDAVEHGWNGTRATAESLDLPARWVELGERLAQQFNPISDDLWN